MISTVRLRTGGLWISLVSLTTSAAGGGSVGSALPLALADGLADGSSLGDADGSPAAVTAQLGGPTLEDAFVHATA